MRHPLSLLATLAVLCLAVPAAAQEPRFEYIDVRWDGVDRMCIVYGNGRVDFIGKELESVRRPDDVDKRAFYMTLAVNRMAAEGYEIVGMITDEIFMRRRAPR